MTELEKKQLGEFFDTRDAEIHIPHNRTKEQMKKYNDIDHAFLNRNWILLDTGIITIGESTIPGLT